MIKEIWHRITNHRLSHPDQSMGQVSQDLGVSRSMVKRHDKRQKKRNQYSESEFWESVAGQLFLKRLIVSSIYTFGIKGGIGAGRIEEFLNQIRISTHAGVSESSIFRIMKEVELTILEYKELVEKELKKEAGTKLEELEVVLGLDETWLNDMLLVCQELSSGYLFLKFPRKKERPKVGGVPSKKI